MNKEELEKLINFLDLRITMRKVDKSNLNYEENQLIKLCITCSDLLKENQKYKEVIDKAIKLIEDDYYSKNTTDIDNIALSGNKLITVRKILKEVE